MNSTEPSEKSLTLREINKMNPFLKILREVLAIFFWFYVITKLFFFNIDLFIFNVFFPGYEGILDYKFLIFVGTIAAIWIFTKNRYVVLWSLYIMFYPLILLFWKIPYFVFKQKSLNLAFALISIVLSSLLSFKYKFIISVFFLISGVIILVASNTLLLLFGTTIICILTVMLYIRKTISIFKSSEITNTYLNFLAILKNKQNLSTLKLSEDLKNLPVDKLNEKQVEKRTSNIQVAVFFNRVLLFIASKLKNFQSNKINYLFYIISILLFLIMTIVSFSLVNYALFKLDTSFFNYNDMPSFFTFIYYSFSGVFSQSISTLEPVLPLSQLISMLQLFGGVYILVIFIAFIVNIKSERNEADLIKIIQSFEEQGGILENFISEEYKINSIDDAIEELSKMKAGLTKLLYKISDNIK